MSTNRLPAIWNQLSPEQRARIVAILVQMLLRQWIREMETQHEPA